MAFVVDTNVLIAANDGDETETHADEICRETCKRRLKSLMERGVVAIDDKGLIVAEYKKHVKFGGGPYMGNAFFKYVFENQYSDERVRRVTVTLSQNEPPKFEELPDNDFDPSDRKFLAVAVVAKATVLNATDSDWDEQATLMDTLGVEVIQLCPQHASK